MPHMTASFHRSSNHNLWGDWKASTTRPYSKFYFNFFAKIVFGEVEDHALIGSKLFKQEVQTTRSLIFKM